MDKGSGEMKVKLYYHRESLGETLPFAFQGDWVLSARELIILITDYPKGLRRS
jgi:hypothetical protein